MAPAYWDPANLLQVTLDIDDIDGEIQCVGQAKSRHNNRCSWTIEDPNRTKVRPLLTQMSTKKPEFVTIETIRQLATLCLCPSYHSRQLDTVMARWSTIIKRAVLHHKSLLKTLSLASPEVGSPLELLLRDTQRALAECQTKTSSLEKHLQVQSSAIAQSEEEVAKDKSRQRAEICFWKHRWEESEDKNRSHELGMMNLQQSNQALTRRINDELKDMNKHEKRVEILQRNLETVSGRLKSCEEEKDEALRQGQSIGYDLIEADKDRESSIETINKLRSESSAARQTIIRLQGEVEARDSSLRQSQVDLTRAQQRISALEENIANLQISELNLKESISTCWLHTLCRWISSFRKSVSSTGLEDTPNSNV